MHLPDVTLHQASTLQQAGLLMEQFSPDARYLAGGTDVLVDLKTGRLGTAHLISISGIKALRGVSAGDAGLRIGSLTTISALAQSQLVRRELPVLSDTARGMASPQVRNLATAGGNIASAVPCADLPPVLMVLRATLLLWHPRRGREVPLETFFAGPRQTALKNGELLRAIAVPWPAPRSGAAYERFALRDGNAIAVASVAAALRLEGDVIRDLRIALGAVSPVPILVTPLPDVIDAACAAEDLERLADAARAACDPISDVRGSGSFRRDLVGTLTVRAVTRAYRQAQEGAPC